MNMTVKERAYRIRKMIGHKKDYNRPADILADIMHYCDHYTDIEDNDSYHNFHNEIRIAERYYYDESEEGTDRRAKKFEDKLNKKLGEGV